MLASLFFLLQLLRARFREIIFGMAVSFEFLDQDIERQRRMARDAIEDAKKLDSLIHSLPDGAEKDALIEARESLMSLARRLVDNVTVTSTTANTVLSTATARST